MVFLVLVVLSDIHQYQSVSVKRVLLVLFVFHLILKC